MPIPASGSQAVNKSYAPTDHDVEELIIKAKEHTLGLPFLLHGNRAAIASLFDSHPFTIDAARERVRSAC